MNPILYFFILFLILNYSFGIIQFLINPMSMNFLGFSKKKSILGNIKIFSNIIKFNADFAMISILLLLLQGLIPQSTSAILLFITCISIFIYQIYYHTIKKIYNTQPNFLMDNKLIQLGFQVVYYGYRMYFFTGILALFILFDSLVFFESANQLMRFF